MLYLIFGDGALHGSSPDFDAALKIADETAGHVDHDSVGILRVDGRWCHVDAKGAVHEVTSDEHDYRPAPKDKQ